MTFVIQLSVAVSSVLQCRLAHFLFGSYSATSLALLGLHGVSVNCAPTPWQFREESCIPANRLENPESREDQIHVRTQISHRS